MNLQLVIASLWLIAFVLNGLNINRNYWLGGLYAANAAAQLSLYVMYA